MRVAPAAALAAVLVVSALTPPQSASAQTADAPHYLDRAEWSVTASHAHPSTPAGNMLDGDLGTGWTTGKGQQAFPEDPEFIVLDAGEAVMFDSIDLAAGAATDDYARSYAVTVSLDGASWTPVASGAGSLHDGVMHLSVCGEDDACDPIAARYVRIEQTSWHYINWWTVAELNLGLTEGAVGGGAEQTLDRAGWSMTASQGWLPAGNMIDGTVDTGWTTGDGQAPGQWIRLDAGASVTFDAIDLAAGAAVTEYARSYTVQISDDGESWTDIAAGDGAMADGRMRISLCESGATCTPVTARHVRVTQTSGHFVNAWTVAEFNLIIGDLTYLRPQATVKKTVVAPGSAIEADIWGLAPFEPITVTAAGSTSSATADTDGVAAISISAPAEEGEFSFTLIGEWTGWTATLEVLVSADAATTDPDPNEGAECGPASDGDPSIVTDSDSVEAGHTVLVSGSGFVEGSYRIELEVEGERILLDDWFECTDGSFEREMLIPATITPGDVELVVVGAEGDAARSPLKIAAAPLAAIGTITITESEGIIDLDWAEVDGATEYQIHRSTGRFSDYIVIDTVPASEYSDFVGTAEKYAYYYKVVPVGAGHTTGDTSAAVSLEAALFGDDMHFFSPTDDAADVDSVIGDVASRMFPFESELSDERYAFMLKPGAYSTAPITLGYYTSVYGLGVTPQDTTVPMITVPAQSADSLTNFWRSAENIGIDTGNPDSMVMWAVSQAAPARRLWVNGNLHLDDWGKSASGGFLADSIVTGRTGSWSQQQYFLRNSDLEQGWYNGGWNHVFLGVKNAPDEPADWAATGWNAVTVENETPQVREKPFLHLDDSGDYAVFVPGLRESATGASWSADNPGVGESIPIGDFHVAKPGVDTAATINAALADGKHLLLTPGIYEIDQTLLVDRPDTIVLGLGMATIRPVGGIDAMHVADEDGITIAGVLFDATEDGSDVLLRVGAEGASGDHRSDPILLADVFTRVGGAVAGRADVTVEINSSDVIADHFWLWRADHGQEAGATGWDKNTSTSGLVVNGDRVVAYGLMVEHFQGYQTLWNGDDGATYFYQSELPYDPPTQADYMSDDGAVKGYASYKVSNEAENHYAVGLGIYDVFIHTGEWVENENAMEVSPGTRVRNAAVVSFGAGGGQNHIVNGVGEGVSSGTATKSGINSYVAPVPVVDSTVRPTGSAAAEGVYSGAVAVELELAEGEGVIEYRLNDGDWSTYDGAIDVDDVGDHEVAYRVRFMGDIYAPASGKVQFTIAPEAAAWSPSTIYLGGESVTYDGRTYIAQWWTANQTPGATSYGAWAQVGETVTCDAGQQLAWTSSWVYTGGETVVAGGHLWRAKWWTRDQAPGDSWGPWEDQGACRAA